jgi:nitrate/nitrite-specific signal transduction histidine kinase
VGARPQGLDDALSLHDALSRMVRRVCALAHADAAAVLAWDPHTSLLYGVVGHGIDDELVRGLELPLYESPAANEAILRKVARRRTDERDPLAAALELQAPAYVPLVCSGKAYGLLAIDGAAVPPGKAGRTLLRELGEFTTDLVEPLCDALETRLPPALRHAGAAAKKLHAGVVQSLFGIGALSRALLLDEDVPDSARPALERIRKLAGSGTQELRAAVETLRRGKPPLLSLGPALEQLTLDARRRSGIEVTLEVDARLRLLDGAVADLFYRVCREAIDVAERRADAPQLSVTCTLDDAGALLVVEDEAGDYEDVEAAAHFALLFLRELAEAIGGFVALQPTRPTGVRIVARGPARRPARLG